MSNRKLEVVYLVVNEDLTSPLLSRQVTELLVKTITNSERPLSIHLILFQTLPSLIRRRRRLARLKKKLKRQGLVLSVIPNIAPWPVPNFRLTRTDVGLRPDGRWNRFAARTFAAYAFPYLVYQFLIKRRHIFHSRSYPPALAVHVVRKIFPKVKHVFDPRSDFPEENITAGRWSSRSEDFKFWKNVERELIESAAATVCISQNYVEHYLGSDATLPHIVAPNNVDTLRFCFDSNARAEVRRALGWSQTDVVFVYLGGMSSGGWHRPEFYREFITRIQTQIPIAKLLMLIPQAATKVAHECMVGIEGVAIRNPDFGEVSRWLSGADIGVMFMHNRKLAVGTKLGEYLSIGLPIVCNSNCLGAVGFIHSYPQSGVVLDIGLGDLDEGGRDLSLEEIKSMMRRSDRLRKLAKSIFDNRVVANSYLDVYRELACKS